MAGETIPQALAQRSQICGTGTWNEIGSKLASLNRRGVCLHVLSCHAVAWTPVRLPSLLLFRSISSCLWAESVRFTLALPVQALALLSSPTRRDRCCSFSCCTSTGFLDETWPLVWPSLHRLWSMEVRRASAMSLFDHVISHLLLVSRKDVWE